MGKYSSSRDLQMRQRIAQEAARIMAEDGGLDFYTAKRKAAEHLGADDTHNLPRNSEVDQALQMYQRLFQNDSHPQRQQHMRRSAREAMQLLQEFDPHLAGPVLLGTAGPHSDIQLHLYAPSIESVIFFLMDHHIPFEQGETYLRFNSEEQAFPSLHFLAGEDSFELVVLPDQRQRPAPKSPIDGKPMKRARLGELQDLLQQSA